MSKNTIRVFFARLGGMVSLVALATCSGTSTDSGVLAETDAQPGRTTDDIVCIVDDSGEFGAQRGRAG